MNRDLAACWRGGFLVALLIILFFGFASKSSAQNLDLSVTKSGPATIAAGTDITYSLTVSGSGGSSASQPPNTLMDTLPTGTTFVSLTNPNVAAGWSCTSPSVGSSGSVTCTDGNPVHVQSFNFTFVFHVNSSVSDGTILTNTATVSHTGVDPDLSNNTSSTSATVSNPAALSGQKTVTGNTFPGSTITYTVILSNSGGADQQDNPGNEFSDVLRPI